jgi:hypothetical protein
MTLAKPVLDFRTACSRLFSRPEVIISISHTIDWKIKGAAENEPTKQELVLVYKISDAKIERAKDENEGCNDRVRQADDKDEDSLGIDHPKVQHRGLVQLGMVWRAVKMRSKDKEPGIQQWNHPPLGVRVKRRRWNSRGRTTASCKSCNGIIAKPASFPKARVRTLGRGREHRTKGRERRDRPWSMT